MNVTSDIDGSNITSLLLCFFVLFLRPLVDSGKIYKALPPLYIIDKKNIKKFYNGNEWLFDKNELYGVFNNMIADNVVVTMQIDNKGEFKTLTKPELRSWLKLNSEYLLELDSLVKRASCNPYILEHVCFFKLIANDLDFKYMIEKKFPECTFDLDDLSLNGSYNGENVSLIVDPLFMKISRRFRKTLSENASVDVYYRNKNEPDTKDELASIGQFLTMMHNSFDVRIMQRLKGLGESDPGALFITTTNPKMRKLIRLSIANLQDTLDVFNLLHGKDPNMRELRRDLLEKTEISYADIDN